MEDAESLLDVNREPLAFDRPMSVNVGMNTPWKVVEGVVVDDDLRVVEVATLEDAAGN